jgi:hypothetical protein
MRTSNMRLLMRLLMAIVVTVLAAILLYFIFLRGERPEDGRAQPPDQHLSSSADSEPSLGRMEKPSLRSQGCREVHRRSSTEMSCG